MTSATIKRLEKRRQALDSERSSWLSNWRDIADHMSPRRLRWLATNRNKGQKLNDKIVDTTPVHALRTATAGMMSGVTSPSRPWFRLVPRDLDLLEDSAVRAWIWLAESRMRQVLAASNLYNGLHTCYEDLLAFGTACLVFEADFDEVIRCYQLPLGSYWLATGPRQDVDTLVREIEMTVGQMVARFGLDKVGESVRSAHRQDNLDATHTVYQAIEPNRDRDPQRADAAGKAWSSIYWQKGEAQALDVTGYDFKPFVAPRWHVTGGDVYGRSPGMDALGDVKQLYTMQRRKGQAIDKNVNPPMLVGTSMQGTPVSLLPGAKTFAPDNLLGSSGGVRPIYQASLNLQDLKEDILQVQQRVRASLYADLFALFVESDRRQITATEIEARRGEKMQILGPALERLQDELINPLIDYLFSLLLQAELLPPPPDALQEQDLQTELTSILAREQRGDVVAGLDRLLNVVGGMIQIAPEAIDKLDTDQVIDEYGALTGAPPRVVRGDDRVQALRAARRQQQQAAQAAALAQQGAAAAKDLAATDTEGKNALTDLAAAANG
ncbi:MAG: portal protein [Rhodospirillales bacterium]